MLVELEAGRVRVDVEHHPLVVAERQRAAHPRVARPRPSNTGRRRRRPTSAAAGAPARSARRRRERHAHPRRAGERGARAAASTPSSTTSTARPSRRSSAGVAPNEPTLAWKSCSGRSGRGVGGAFGSGSRAAVLLRLLGPLVVAAHRVRVDDQLQLRGRRQVLARASASSCRVTRASASGSSSSTWTGDGWSTISDWYGGSGGTSPVAALGVGVVGLGERADRRQRVTQPLRRHAAGPAGAARRVVEQPAQRAVLVEVGERPQQPAGHGVAGEAGRRRAARP